MYIWIWSHMCRINLRCLLFTFSTFDTARRPHHHRHHDIQSFYIHPFAISFVVTFNTFDADKTFIHRAHSISACVQCSSYTTLYIKLARICCCAMIFSIYTFAAYIFNKHTMYTTITEPAACRPSFI